MRTFGSKGPLVYIVQESFYIPDIRYDPLTANADYGASGSMLEEIIIRLPHSGPIFCDDNKTVFIIIAKAVSGTSVKSAIKSYFRSQYVRAAFLALIVNHTGDTKYRYIVKSRSNFLHNIKWNGRNYPLGQHVSNHCTVIDDIGD